MAFDVAETIKQVEKRHNQVSEKYSANPKYFNCNKYFEEEVAIFSKSSIFLGVVSVFYKDKHYYQVRNHKRSHETKHKETK